MMDEQENQDQSKNTDSNPESKSEVAPSEQPAASSSNQNMNATLAYAFGWITGIIFLLTEKENDYIRFHAAQSVIVFGSLNIIVLIPFLGWMVATILGPIGLILWVILMVKAYQGERFKLPLCGDYAEKLKDKIGK